jgi:hypothetical protein
MKLALVRSQSQREVDFAIVYRQVDLHGAVLAVEIIYRLLRMSIDQSSDK